MDLMAKLEEGLGALGIEVPLQGRQALLLYLEELQRWSRKINLTAIRDATVGLEKHLLDAMTVRPLIRGDERLVDLGSGAGLPGIPLKISCPEIGLVSVDAVEKKVIFQRHILRKLALDGRVEHARIETLPANPEYRNGFDLVTARAFSSLETLVELAAPLLKKGGRIIAMKGPEGEREWRDSQLSGRGWGCEEMHRIQLPFSGAQRALLVIVKSE